MHTSASAVCALTMYSTESAMISRLGSEYSMPPWPMAIPSSTAIVWNSRGIATSGRHRFGDDVADILEVHGPGTNWV